MKWPLPALRSLGRLAEVFEDAGENVNKSDAKKLITDDPKRAAEIIVAAAKLHEACNGGVTRQGCYSDRFGKCRALLGNLLYGTEKPQ